MQARVAWGRSLRDRSEEQGAADRQGDGDELAELGARARALVDRGLGEAAGRRHGPKERPRRTRQAAGQELLVVVDRRFGLAAHGAADGQGLQEHHDGDGEGAGRQLLEVVQRGDDRRREPGRHRRDERDAMLVDGGERDQQDAAGHGDQGPGHLGGGSSQTD
jgi:hypothetical protein